MEPKIENSNEKNLNLPPVDPSRSRRKISSKSKKKREYKVAAEDSFNSGTQPNIPSYSIDNNKNENISDQQIKGQDEETMGDSIQSNYKTPYEFLTQKQPSISSIFFPRFTVKSVTFVLTLIFIVCFLILMIFNYAQQQTDIRWNCSLYQLQNKYYPALRYRYEVWRVVISAFFHSNIAHFVLNLFGLQLYGYFVEWYYGPKKYIVVLICSLVFSHFFTCMISQTSVSTTASSILFAVLTLKAFFLFQYRNYNKLYNRRAFLYILLVLIVAINLIPVFVVNNVDIGSYLGGIIVGFFFGLYFLLDKEEQPQKKIKFFKFGGVILLICLFIILVSLSFGLSDEENRLLSENIDQKCNE